MQIQGWARRVAVVNLKCSACQYICQHPFQYNCQTCHAECGKTGQQCVLGKECCSGACYNLICEGGALYVLANCLADKRQLSLQLGASCFTVSTVSVQYLQYFAATRGLISHSIYSIYTVSTVFHCNSGPRISQYLQHLYRIYSISQL
jgi:hypothetical protein